MGSRRKPLASWFILLIALSATALNAQAPGGKIALVIGNASYTNLVPLRTPVNDAADIAEALSFLGFKVTKLIDGTHAQMEEAFQAFGDALKGAEVGLFYFAGHAFADEENYIAAVDAAGSTIFAAKKSSFMDRYIYKLLFDSGVKLGIVVLDASRRPTPAKARWPSPNGIGSPRLAGYTNLLVAIPARSFTVAPESEGRNSLFTGTLLKYIRTPELSVTEVFSKVGKEIMDATKGKQIPGTFRSGTFYAQFKLADSTVGGKPREPTTAEKTLGSMRLSIMLAGIFYVDGKEVTSFGNIDPGTHTVEIRYGYGNTETKQVTVEAGKASPVAFELQEKKKPKESMVRLQFPSQPRGYLIGKWEVTQAEWQEAMGEDENHKKTADDEPVVNVSWYDAIKYCNARSLRERLKPYYAIEGRKVSEDLSSTGYRLPTKEEWLYAARGAKESGGSAYSGGNDPDEVAWFDGNSPNAKWPRLVGTKKANEPGIWDMSGNVWEWCYAQVLPIGDSMPSTDNPDPRMVFCGGSFRSAAADVQVKSRRDEGPDYAANDLGFRVARDAEPLRTFGTR